MKAVIIGGTAAGLEAALGLRERGAEVTIVVSSTFLGEDSTGTWRDFPACMQKNGHEKLASLMKTAGKQELDILMAGALKKLFLEIALNAGVRIRYMTRVIGVESDGCRVTGVRLAGKHGAFTENCDALLDAGLYRQLTWNLAGSAPVFRAGSKVSMMLEYMDLCRPEETAELENGVLLPGKLGGGHGFCRVEMSVPEDRTLPEVRNLLLRRAVDAALEVHGLERYRNARLLSAFSPDLNPGGGYPETVPAVTAEGVYPAEEWRSVDFAPAGRERETKLFLNPERTARILVAGGGTAGMRAALSAADKGADVLLAEFFTTLGGTRTVGGIQPPYFANRNELFMDMWTEMTGFAGRTGGLKDGRTSAACEALLYEKRVSESGIRLLRPAAAFSVERDGERIEKVYFATESGVEAVRPEIVIDATGDADIAVFAGAGTDFGNAEMGLTQNYSQSFRISGTEYDRAMADQDVIDNTDPEEWTRCIQQDTLGCAPYDMVEMLTVRESRRIRGKDCVRLADIYRGRRTPDTIYDAMSDYDTHSRCFSPVGRYGVIPMHAPTRFIAVPYKALLPEKLSNLLVCGKALSTEQEGVAFLRMSPDIMCIGWIAGCLAAQAVEKKRLLENVDLTEVQEEMLRKGALVREVPDKETWENNARMIAARLAAGDESAFADAMLTRWPELPRYLYGYRKTGLDSKPMLVDEVLMAYGDNRALDSLIGELDRLNRKFGKGKYSNFQNGRLLIGGYSEIYDDYWQINRLVTLLAGAADRKAVPVLKAVMENTVAGADWRDQTAGYMRLRPDALTHGNFDRMLAAAYAACALPDPAFREPLEAIITANREAEKGNDAYPVYWLDIKLAQAAYLCGSDIGRRILEEYTSSERYSVLRRFAGKVLETEPDRN